MYAILPFAFILFLLLVIFLSRFFGKKISTKLSIRLMGVYGMILLLSPFLAAFATDTVDKDDGITETPDFYYQEILENYGNYSLENLQNEEYLKVIKETELRVSTESFSDDDPFVISTTGLNVDGWYDRDYGYTMIVERSDEVENIIITQFQQRGFIQGYEVTQGFEPWTWTLDHWGQGAGRLKATLNRSEISLFTLTPPPFAFQFDEGIASDRFGGSQVPSLNVGTINWILIPEDLPIRFQGSEPHRLIERDSGTE